MIDIIAIILTLIIAVSAIYQIRKNLKKESSEYLNHIYGFGLNDEDNISNRYIEPNGGRTDPQGRSDQYFDDSATKLLSKEVTRFLRSGSNTLLILGGPGMGKSTFALQYHKHLYSRSNRSPWRSKLVAINNLENLEGVYSTDMSAKTCVIMDGLDENPEAHIDLSQFQRKLWRLTDRFNKRIILCRTQFYPNDNALPTDTGKSIVGVTSGLPTRKDRPERLYIYPFNDIQTQTYIDKHVHHERDKKLVRSIIDNIDDLYIRPLILYYICESPGAIVAKEKFWIYKSISRYWASKEDAWISGNDLIRISSSMAGRLYEHESNTRESASISSTTFAEILNTGDFTDVQGAKLIESTARSRSLLARDKNGNLRFSHRSFMEYFYVLYLFNEVLNAQSEILSSNMIDFVGSLVGNKRINELLYNKKVTVSIRDDIPDGAFIYHDYGYIDISKEIIELNGITDKILNSLKLKRHWQEDIINKYSGNRSRRILNHWIYELNELNSTINNSTISSIARKYHDKLSILRMIDIYEKEMDDILKKTKMVNRLTLELEEEDGVSPEASPFADMIKDLNDHTTKSIVVLQNIKGRVYSKYLQHTGEYIDSRKSNYTQELYTMYLDGYYLVSQLSYGNKFGRYDILLNHNIYYSKINE